MALTTGAIDDYAAFCREVTRICGIDLSQYKRGQMERRIRSFVGQRGYDDLHTFARVIGRESEELDAFLDRVTINVTQLWRNPEQWKLVEEQVVPALLKDSNRLRCWSAGSSYGAEAYTLAAIVSRVAPQADTSILGTDIDARMVEKAAAGVFTAEDARSAEPEMLHNYFTRNQNGDWLVADHLKRLVRFEQGDLLKLRPRRDAYDLVLCRNTVIYFNQEVRDALHARLIESLRSGGVMIVGNTERIVNPTALGLTSEIPFIYRKN